MPNAERPQRVVPRVFAEDGGGYSRPAVCVLCGKRIRKSALTWGRLPTDPQSLGRPLHAVCLNEYVLYARALDLGCDDVTPTL